MGVIITAYTVIGGLYAIAWAGLILIFGILLVVPFILVKAGGLEVVNTALASIDPNLVLLAFPANYAGIHTVRPDTLFLSVFC